MRLLTVILLLAFQSSALGEQIRLSDIFDPNKAESVTLHALDGSKTDPPNFLGFRILGSSTSTSHNDVAAFFSEIQFELDQPRSGVTLCFIPRHAVSFPLPDGNVDVLICYECENLRIYRNSTEVLRTSISNRSVEKMDAMFREKGLEPAAPPNKLLELTVDPQAGSLPQTTLRLNGSSTRC